MTKPVSRPREGISLEVTPEIIDRAVSRDSGHCIVADALRAAIPDATRVSVDLQTVRFSLESTGRRYIYLTPQAAQHFLIDFDQGIKPRPGRVRLSRPIQSVPIHRERKTNRPKGAHLPKDDPGAKHVAMVSDGHGHDEPVIMGGETPRIAALADPPAQRKDPKTNQRYPGQRRQFGLRILRP